MFAGRVLFSQSRQRRPSEEVRLRQNSREARRWFVVVVFWGKKNVTGTPTVLLLFNAVQIGV